MTDFDSIWRTQDEIRTVVNAVLGENVSGIWSIMNDGWPLSWRLPSVWRRKMPMRLSISFPFRQTMTALARREQSSCFIFNSSAIGKWIDLFLGIRFCRVTCVAVMIVSFLSFFLRARTVQAERPKDNGLSELARLLRLLRRRPFLQPFGCKV